MLATRAMSQVNAAEQCAQNAVGEGGGQPGPALMRTLRSMATNSKWTGFRFCMLITKGGSSYLDFIITLRQHTAWP
jgi:hypothetical protein